MEKIKTLNRYPRILLIVMTVMALVFSVLYRVTVSNVGFEYQDAIFVPRQENGGTVYSGKLRGQRARFTVSEDRSVVFQCGDRTYGPYTAKEDPAAVPEDNEMAGLMTGVELRRGETVLFRGGVLKFEDSCFLFNEDGGSDNGIEFSYETGDGTARDETGSGSDLAEPSPSVVLELMDHPELTHKGEWLAWFGAVFLCALNACSILFADELFRWTLRRQTRNVDVDHAEPSDLEIAGRYLSWTVVTITALVLFVLCLR